MKPALLDTDTVSYFLRGEPAVRDRVAAYLDDYDCLNMSILTYYEIQSGLAYRDNANLLSDFQQFADLNRVFPLTREAANTSARWYAQLRKRGRLIDDVDLLIAGIAETNDLLIVTHNRSHFDRIPELEVEDWMDV